MRDQEVRIPSINKRIVGLDELRGIAIIVVLIGHGRGLIPDSPKLIAGIGHYGVILFFFISGFIIAKILLSEREKYSRSEISKYEYFSTFYIRRIFRILPLFFLSLLISAILYPETSQYFKQSVVFIQNYYWANTDKIMMRTDVTWSLAVEEHMYIVFPALFFFLRRNQAIVALACIIVAGFLFLSGVFPHGPFNHHKFFVTHMNMQYIALGALLAFGNLGRYLAVTLMVMWLIFCGLMQLKGIKVGAHGIGGQVIDSVSFFVVMLISLGYLRGISKLGFLRYIGLRCYGIYIIHFFVSVLVIEYLGRSVEFFVVYIVVSLLLAEISLRYFEEPIQNHRAIYEKNKLLSKELFKLMGIGLFGVTCLIVLG